MRAIFWKFSALTSTLLAFATPVLAQEPPKLSDLEIFLVRMVDILYAFGGVVFFFILVYLGIQWMTSQGADDKLQELNQRVTYFIIGFVLFFLSYGIVLFIFNFFSVQSCGTGGTITPGFNIIYETECN